MQPFIISGEYTAYVWNELIEITEFDIITAGGDAVYWNKDTDRVELNGSRVCQYENNRILPDIINELYGMTPADKDGEFNIRI